MISAAAPSEIELELAAVTVPPSRNAGLSVGIFSGRPFGGCSSVETSVSDFARLHADRRDLPGKIAVRDRTVGALKRTDGIGVLRSPCELIGFRAILRERAHEAPLVVGVLEAVEKHMIERAAVTHAIAERARSSR